MTLDPLQILEKRTKRTLGQSYRIGDQGSYALDVISPETVEIDEGRKSVVIPFGDGSRRDDGGDLLNIEGISLERHRVNPVVLFDHGKGNHKWASWPVAMAEDPVSREYTVVLDPVGKTAKLNAFWYQGKDVPNAQRDDEKEFALYCDQLYDLIARRFIRGGSIGYKVIQAYQLQPNYDTGTPPGLDLQRVLMLEGSAVVMPMNMDTVRKSLGCDRVGEVLSMPSVCGKPLSPYLVKSLSVYAPERKAQMGYEAKSLAGMSQKAKAAMEGFKKKTGRDVWQVTESVFLSTVDPTNDRWRVGYGDDAVYKEIVKGATESMKDVPMEVLKQFRGESWADSEIRYLESQGKKDMGTKALRTKYGRKSVPSDVFGFSFNVRKYSPKEAVAWLNSHGYGEAARWRSGVQSSQLFYSRATGQPGLYKEQVEDGIEIIKAKSLAETKSHIDDFVVLQNKVGLFFAVNSRGTALGPYWKEREAVARAKEENARNAEKERAKQGKKSTKTIYRTEHVRNSADANFSGPGWYVYTNGRLSWGPFESQVEADEAQAAALQGGQKSIETKASSAQRAEFWIELNQRNSFMRDRSSMNLDLLYGPDRVPGRSDRLAVGVQGDPKAVATIKERYMKSLSPSEIRKKYRSVKGLRRRVKSSRKGTSVLRVRGKDLDRMRQAAEAKGIQFSHMGTDDKGIAKVKLTGDDSTIDSLAREHGMKMKSMAGNKGLWIATVQFPDGSKEEIEGDSESQARKRGEQYATSGAWSKPGKVVAVREDKQKNMKTKDMDAPDAPEDVPEETAEVSTEEKLGAQVLRQMHEDHRVLLEHYDKWMEMLESDAVKKALEKKLQSIASELDDIEALWEKEYGDAGYKDLDGAGDEEEEEKDIDNAETDAVEADSDPEREEDEPTEEEAIDEMDSETKSLRRRLVKSLRSQYGKKSVCSECGSENCKCGKSLKGKRKDVVPGDEENQDVPEASDFDSGDLEKSFEDHEKEKIGEAKSYLSELKEKQDFTDDDRMKSYHFHKTLDPMGVADEEANVTEKAFDVMDEADQMDNVTNAEKGFKFMRGEKVTVRYGPGAGIEGVVAAVNGSKVTIRDSNGDEEVFDAHQLDSKSLSRKALTNEEADDLKQDIDRQMEDTEEKGMRLHRKSVGRASKYFKGLSCTKDFGDDHRSEAAVHEEALEKAINEVQEEADEDLDPEEPGTIGEKHLKAMRAQQKEQQSKLKQLQKQLSEFRFA